MKRLPLPPYGNRLLEKIKRNEAIKNDIRLLIGKRAWEAAKAFSTTQIVLMLPLDVSPYQFRWPVAELPILIIDTGDTSTILIKQLAHVLLASQAEVVRAILINGAFAVYRRD